MKKTLRFPTVPSSVPSSLRFLALGFCTFAITTLPASSAPKRLGAADLDPVTVLKAPRHLPVPLVTNGKPVAVIYNTQSGEMIDQLMTELATSIEETTGAKLPVVTQPPAAETPAIIIDDGTLAGVDSKKLPIEGYVIQTAPNRVFLVGSTQSAGHLPNHGAAWAVADFLERAVGVRWFWPLSQHGRTVEKKSTLAVAPMHYSDAPAFRKREGWPPFYEGTPFGNINVRDLYANLRGGSSWPVALQVHNPQTWDKVYLKDRPEIFALREDGTRNPMMYSYLHPRTLETFMENIDLYAATPADKRDDQGWRAAQPDHLADKLSFIHHNSITVSPPDLGVYDTYEASMKLYEPEKGSLASGSRLMGEFVRRLCEQVKKKHPEMTVIYLPYLNYTLAPKNIVFPDNLEVQLCGMPGIAMYKQPALNAQFQANIDAWAKHTRRPVQTWDYSCWPTDRTKAPFQYPHVLKDYYMSNRSTLVGTFINGGESDEWLTHHFTMYCWMKLMWDPQFDVDAAAVSFSQRMFGPAAAPMHALLKLQTDRWEKVQWKLDKISPTALYGDSYTAPVIEQMKKLLAEAHQKAAGDEVILARLKYYESPFPAFYAEAESMLSGKGLRSLNAQKVAANPVIDGKLDDQWWQAAEAVTGFMGKWQENTWGAKYPTHVKAVWTLDGITFGFKMDEPNTKALKMDIKQRDDGALWPQNDNMELFVDVTGAKAGNYYQWLINPIGTVLDIRDDDPAWNPDKSKVATFVGEDFWSVEVFLPYAMFADEKDFVKPAGGKSWVGQFARHRISDGRDSDADESLNEYNRFNNILGGFTSNAADFGTIQFVE